MVSFNLTAENIRRFSSVYDLCALTCTIRQNEHKFEIFLKVAMPISDNWISSFSSRKVGNDYVLIPSFVVVVFTDVLFIVVLTQAACKSGIL